MAEFDLNERQKSAFKAANEYAASCNQDPICFAFVEGAKWADRNREKELQEKLEHAKVVLDECKTKAWDKTGSKLYTALSDLYCKCLLIPTKW